jgi:hypothetical protein
MTAQQRTLNGLAVPSGGGFGDGLRDGPVLGSDLNRAHRELGRGPCRTDGIGLAACGRVLCGRADDDRLGRDGCEAIDMCTQVQLDDVAGSKGRARLGIGAVGCARMSPSDRARDISDEE